MERFIDEYHRKKLHQKVERWIVRIVWVVMLLALGWIIGGILA